MFIQVTIEASRQQNTIRCQKLPCDICTYLLYPTLVLRQKIQLDVPNYTMTRGLLSCIRRAICNPTSSLKVHENKTKISNSFRKMSSPWKIIFLFPWIFRAIMVYANLIQLIKNTLFNTIHNLLRPKTLMSLYIVFTRPPYNL